MTTDRILILLGLACIAVVAFGHLTGVAAALPGVEVALLLVGLGALVAGWRLGSDGSAAAPADGPPASTGWVRNAAMMLGALGALALVIAVFVAEGEATGHAIGHLMVGAVAFTLFVTLGFFWRPRTGTQAALIRRVVLLLLLVATFGSFVESMGGAGYDPTNSTDRVRTLTLLHDVALPFSALGMPGVILGAVAGVVVLTRGALRRLRTT